MSKLLERIRRANAGEGVRMGFGAAATAAVPPRPALIVRQPAAGKEALMSAVGTGADAVLLDSVPGRGDLEAALEGSDKSLVGLAIEDSIPATLADLTEAGLDFLVLRSTRLPVAVLRQDQFAIGIEVAGGLDDTRLRALAGAPGAFAITRLPGGNRPTIEDLIEVRRIGLFLARPVFAETPADLTTDDLAALRDSDLSAILVELGDPGTVTSLRDRLNDLPAPAKPPTDRPAAVLPAGSPGGRNRR